MARCNNIFTQQSTQQEINLASEMINISARAYKEAAIQY